jgi:hypothetical protein
LRGGVARTDHNCRCTTTGWPDDYFPIEQMQLMRFNGEAWELFGDVITGEVGHDATR